MCFYGIDTHIFNEHLFDLLNICFDKCIHFTKFLTPFNLKFNTYGRFGYYVYLTAVYLIHTFKSSK